MPIEYNLTYYHQKEEERRNMVEPIVKDIIDTFNNGKCKCGECKNEVYEFTNTTKFNITDKIKMITIAETIGLMLFSCGIYSDYTMTQIKLKK